MSQEVLSQLVAMSNKLGDPANDLAILGEGNTSARADADTFYLKASGTELRTITPDGIVRCRFDKVLSLLDAENVTDEMTNNVFAESVVEGAPKRPSVETLLHALLLSSLGDVNFVAHTHPTWVNMLTCSQMGEAAVKGGRLFPDELVCCGIAPVWIPFTDPGVPLALKIRQELTTYVDTYGIRPKVLLVQNHGLISLGTTPAEAENGQFMMVKTAKILIGTFWLGGPHYLSAEQVERIWNRPDELYRINLLENR
jgi:rhamnose utilization protein RhaD (predicted bifunctional aldolase and dehydrogenase)